MEPDWLWLKADYSAYLLQVCEAGDSDKPGMPLTFLEWITAQPLGYQKYHGWSTDSRPVGGR